MQDASAASPAASRARLLLIGLIALLPLLAAAAAFLLRPAVHLTNYGELVAVRQLPPETLRRLDGAALPAASLRGRWLVLLVAPAACASDCRGALYAMRQSRLMQGKDMQRIERLWLVRDAGQPDAGLLREHPGLAAARDPDGHLPLFLDPPGARNGLYLVDPRGFVFMRYSLSADPAGLARDLKRVLAASQIG